MKHVLTLTALLLAPLAAIRNEARAETGTPADGYIFARNPGWLACL